MAGSSSIHGLATLFRGVGGVASPVPELAIAGIATDSSRVTPGDLFVALRGTNTDGHDYLPAAIAAGAAAVCVESPPRTPVAAPVVRVPSTRTALAELAAAWHGHPAERLTLVGITGTVGKTSTLTMLESALTAGGIRAATIGSLGVRMAGERVAATSHTTPEPIALHGDLARLANDGCDMVAMEASSHGLVQQRLYGLAFHLGIFTNLLPLEHSDYHASFREYVAAKRLFLDHMRPCAPLLYNADDRAVRRVVHRTGIEPVGCGTGRSAVARVTAHTVAVSGTALTLELRRPVPAALGDTVGPLSIDLRLRLLGRSNIANAALAACAALCLGIDADVIARALAAFPPPPRRLEVVHDGDITVLDDTVGHPDSISALFEVVTRLQPRRVLVVWAVRGGRGVRINRESARSLAVWIPRLPVGLLVVTRSAETAGEHDTVTDAEYEAFLQPLRGEGHPLLERDRLADAVATTLDDARTGDMVLLLGAQGMDGGASLVRERVGRG